MECRKGGRRYGVKGWSVGREGREEVWGEGVECRNGGEGGGMG